MLVERPLGLSADQVRLADDAARRTGAFVLEALWTRFLLASVRFRELVAQGLIAGGMGVRPPAGFPFPAGRSVACSIPNSAETPCWTWVSPLTQACGTRSAG